MTMSKHLQDYVKVYKDFVDPAFCKKLVSQMDSINWKQHTFYDSVQNVYVSYDHELAISNEHVDGKNELMDLIWNALKKYVVEDMQSVHEWYNGWAGHSEVRFNRYDPTTKMKIHCDHIHSLFDGERKGVPVLTVLGALNNDYTGGELVMWDDEVIELPAGAVMVFPSNFLYPHEVRPVKTGIRYSFVSWAW